MTIKTLFFSLFLYVCLVWVGAFYLRPNEVQQSGLFWTAIGLIAVLAFIVGARLFGWWRLSRAKAAARPATPVRPVPIVHEDDAALAGLIAEANTNLAKAPAYAAKGGTTPLSGMPLYLLIGPEGSGKTSTFVNSGLEPQLLAGQVAGTVPIMPTRLCNLWVAKDAIFAELSGRVFSGDPARWTQLLKVLHGNSSVPMWRRLWSEPEQGLALRGAIAFCDAKEFTGTPNSQALERRSRDIQERLRAVGEVFGIDFPVYQIITKCDAVPFFPDFFRRLPEPEANQVWGCTLPLHEPGGAEVSAEEQAKRITRSFRPLYQEIAKRRITQLAHEPDPARRPAVYEFPRELKRIRTPLIQFLSETFRPHPLRLGALLRGYYFTGIREVAVAAANLGETRADWSIQSQKGDMEATRLFSAADATRIFRPGDLGTSPKASGQGPLVPRWMFVSDLFHGVVLADRPGQKAPALDLRVELYRKGIFAAACGLCLLLCFAFFWSWNRNRALLGEIGKAETGIELSEKTMLGELGALDILRGQIESLNRWKHSTPWGLSWGLYSGNRVLDNARQAYFRRFYDLLLNKLNGEIVGRLQAAPTAPVGDSPDEHTYNLLKTHLMIAGSCTPPDSFVIAQVLTSTRKDVKLAAGSQKEEDLADTQIQFYANELAPGSPSPVTVDPDARDRARHYLQNSKDIDTRYRSILSDAEKKLPKQPHLSDLAPNYAQVLNGQPEPSGAFTPAGWKLIKTSNAGTTAAVGDPCIVGGQIDARGNRAPDEGDARKLQRLFVADYVKHWRSFVQGFSVIPYRSAEDAARKLHVLADPKSPLLTLFLLIGNQTNFQATAEERSDLDKDLDKVPVVGKVLSKLKKVEQAAQKPESDQTDAKEMKSPGDITRIFQPVHAVVTPGSDPMVGKENNGYVDALEALGQSMHAIARDKGDLPAQQLAEQNYEKAIDAARQLAKEFHTKNVEDLNTTVQTLLEQPILNTKSFINTDVDKAKAGQINGDLKRFCALSANSTLRKYPFHPLAADEVSLEEMSRLFAPKSGAIWTFQKQTLGELTAQEGPLWKANPTGKLQVTPEMLTFLNQAQTIANVFYAGDAAQPHLNYTLRPDVDSSLKDWTLTLTIDGKKKEWTPSSQIQTMFEWPASAAKDREAVGRIQVGGLSPSFASRGGLWGVFRIMGDAEPRPQMQKVVEWKYLHSGDGRKELLQPPVRLVIVKFPGDVDVFNPNFFQGLQCPPKAVQ